MDFLKKASASRQEGGSKSDLFKQAQEFLAEHDKKKKPAPAASQPAAAYPAAATDPPATAAAPAAHKQNYGEVYSSAQILYQGIQDKLSGKAEVDNHKLAGAANDVLKAAESSGLLGKDERYKDYFTKAEGFLSSYAGKTGAAKPSSHNKPEGRPHS